MPSAIWTTFCICCVPLDFLSRPLSFFIHMANAVKITSVESGQLRLPVTAGSIPAHLCKTCCHGLAEMAFERFDECLRDYIGRRTAKAVPRKRK